MFRKRRLAKTIKIIFKQFSKNFLSLIKKQLIWLLRTLFVTKRRRGSLNAGFVLPTVVMVSLVVVLLTTAILFRSFERSKNASNVRVNETVLRAAAPALDRAKAKLEKLFQDPRLPRSTPSDFSLSQVITDNIAEYTFGDEIQLKLVKDVNADGTILEDETSKSVWKYPVDTDNDGKFDSFALYGIYFKTPTTNRARSPLEARAQPMDEGLSAGRCSTNVATSADLVGSQGWYKVAGKLKRSIFVYTTTVPITKEPDLETFGTDYTKYQEFKGNKSFAALEYQQDRERVPLTNNAVIYENDLEISPGGGLRINGRIFTNGNLLTRNSVRFFQVSSPYSCYYTEENSKIVVAGNVINTRISETTDTSSATSVVVDFFKDVKPHTPSTSSSPKTADNINNTNKSVPTAVYGNQAGFNDAAYAQRINRLVDAASSMALTSLPREVQDGITSAQQADATLSDADAKTQQLTTYFKKRTRRVPYAEVPVGGDGLVRTGTGAYDYTTTSPLQDSGDALRPVDVWAFPFAPSDGTTETDGYAGIGIQTQSDPNKIYLQATDPGVLRNLTTRQELLIGDRVLVGNNLPQYWYSGGKFVSSEQGQNIVGKQWDNNSNIRQRFTQAIQLDDLGSTERGGFWEKVASEKPTGPLDVVGGLRVITGAGIYLPDNRTPTSTATDFDADLDLTNATDKGTDKVWSDRMPMGVTSTSDGLPNAHTPYLKMRATVVYHYQNSFYDPKTPSTYQTPIACVASYYDPTNSDTAQNRDTDFGGNALTGLTGVSKIDPDSPANTANKSLNGIVYSASGLSTSGYTAALNYQKDLKYPNGRWVNKPLRDALANTGDLSLSEQSAIDSAVCALKILDGSIGAPTNAAVPHGAIREVTFLDARQIKAVEKLNPNKATTYNYDLDVEFRQPLEIRTTVLDLNLLRTTSRTDGEFLFPNSGIIYATRDDALPDVSSAGDPNAATIAEIDLSSKDFKLDPTRRPNGIMLINGSNLSRNSTYKAEEKGLILASDLPVYIKGNFNRHTKEEFLATLNSGWANFYTRGNSVASGLDSNFACRKDQFSSCSTGESWRSATVLADAITVLSGNFQEGWRNEGNYELNDNYGNYPVGFDFDGDGKIKAATTVKLNETAIRFDANGNGNMTDPEVTQLDETVIKADLNGNGNMLDTAVDINESNITATVAARLSGFWNNNFVTSRDFQDSTYSRDNSTDPPIYKTSGSLSSDFYSSYFNNFVTPVQRRVTFSEYVMEICRKPTVTACKASDWVVGYDVNNNGNLDDLAGYDFNSDGDLDDTEAELDLDFNGDTVKAPTFKERDLNNDSYLNNAIYDKNGDGDLDDSETDADVNTDLDGDGIKTADVKEQDIKTKQRITEKNLKAKALITQSDTPDPNAYDAVRLIAGTTAQPAMLEADRNYPRRVAFVREGNNLKLDPTSRRPIPIGISTTSTGKVNYYPYSTLSINGKTYSAFSTSNVDKRPRTQSNALWFRTWKTLTSATDRNYAATFPLKIDNISSLSETTNQPLLVPVLQIQFPFQTPSDINTLRETEDGNRVINNGDWFQRATATETNVVFAQGDTPSRPPTPGATAGTFADTGELGGGLENFIRFLENWSGRDLTARGSFIQFKRSSYATAPWQGMIGNFNLTNRDAGYSPSGTTIFGYPQGYRVNSNNVTGENQGRSPFYVTPTRAWGFDVALLTQLPDLFSQRFTSPALNPPNEFYREVPRDDKWVKSLLCAAQDNRTGGYDDADPKYNDAVRYKYAVRSDQRPSDLCPKS
ncbi:hormogonium polysaccharide biosynthesis protein HpsA [Nostoc sp. UHCC 0702]|nr:hormogonium polysaccharide biosynthesis protein HpsA [Nostoc sp. UHCC 0702]